MVLVIFGFVFLFFKCIGVVSVVMFVFWFCMCFERCFINCGLRVGRLFWRLIIVVYLLFGFVILSVE